MQTRFDDALRAQVTVDDQQRIRQINYFDQLWESEAAPQTAREAAEDYVRSVAGALDVPDAQLRSLQESASFVAPRQEDVQFRVVEEKTLFDSTTVGYAQTVNNIPVWGAGMTVTVKHGPYRVVSATNTSHDHPKVKKLPANGSVKKFQGIFNDASNERAIRKNARIFKHAAGAAAEAAMVPSDEDSKTAPFVRRLLGREKPAAAAAVAMAGTAESAAPRDRARVIRGRFYIYQYDPKKRLPRIEDFVETVPKGKKAKLPKLPFDLKPVPDSIKPGEYYLVSEVTMSFNDQTWGDLVWQALVEVETETVLFLQPMAAGVTGLIFRTDPITATGNAANTSDKSNGVLNPLRSSVTLPNLNGPVGGVQSLVGSRTALSEEETPVVAAPTKPAGANFDFNVRTNDFAAVNAYYHTETFFQTVEGLGFPQATYFDGTDFPVEVDHRGLGTVINAHCVGNGAGGIDHCCYALGDLTDTGNPLGRACDSRVFWHEVGGHGVLYEHVNSPNFGFSHSAGDGLSAIFHDPESKAPDRFRYAPWNPSNLRRFDRTVAAGWGWGGPNDVGGYSSEEILATSHFRIYRSIGGDSTFLERRKFASRMMLYLILRTIGTLTPATNPANALTWCNALMGVDLLNWTTEGIFGGAYNKVIRWAFEKQGLFGGKPPAVDVYIDDGRQGEYAYQPNHWSTAAIWNRNAADNGTTHQQPVFGTANFVYVRVKNRGTQTANNVKVKGFHCKPGAGLLWPNDLQPMATPELSAGTLLGNNAQEKIVGPFKWSPISNVFGHDCLIMIASANGDPSNVDQFTAGESIPEWRLVPNDNNIGQRNVQPVPGGGGSEGLTPALNALSFIAGNPNKKVSMMELKVSLPTVLEKKGWKVAFSDTDGGKFRLQSGAKREIHLSVETGQNFTASDVKKTRQRSIGIEVYADGILVGGMTYSLDPDMKKAKA